MKPLETTSRISKLDFVSDLYAYCPFPILAMDVLYQLQSWNHKALEFLGYSENELTESTLIDLLPDTECTTLLKELNTLTNREKTTLMSNHSYKSKDGNILPALTVMIGHYTCQHELRGMSAIVIDLSFKGFPVSDFCHLYASVPLVPHEHQTYWGLLINMIAQKYHEDFYRKIRKHLPCITENELRHAVFARLNIPAKQVCKILFTTSRSVETARYRLKKRLHLDKKTTLFEFLNSL